VKHDRLVIPDEALENSGSVLLDPRALRMQRGSVEALERMNKAARTMDPFFLFFFFKAHNPDK